MLLFYINLIDVYYNIEHSRGGMNTFGSVIPTLMSKYLEITKKIKFE